MARILAVDDEETVLTVVKETLGEEGHEICTASDGLQAMARAGRWQPDLVVLDVQMPGANGIEVCRKLREDPALSDVFILFLTAKSAVEERVEGLQAGGDDYLSKPFDVDELRARVAALLRRKQTRAEDKQEALQAGDFHLDLPARSLHVVGSDVSLTPTEFDLLHYLLAHAEEVFTADELLEEIWDYHPGTGDTGIVRWHVKNLRSKIEPDPEQPVYLRTVSRHGYALYPGGSNAESE